MNAQEAPESVLKFTVEGAPLNFIVPVSANAPFPHVEHMKHWDGRAANDFWPRRAADGRMIGGQVRFLRADGGKDDLLVSRARTNGGAAAWFCRKLPGKQHLFGLDELARKPAAKVLVVEGPKTREAAADHFPGWAVVSVTNANSPKEFDWTPLDGRDVVIWPDADVPGRRDFVGGVCQALGLAVDGQVVNVPVSAPKSWDLADPIPDGWRLDEMLLDALPATVRLDPVELGNGISTFEDLEMQERSWMWPPFIPDNCFAILAGAGGIGKTTTAIAFCAWASRGKFPDGYQREPVKCLIIEMQDDAADDVKPILIANGYDPKMVLRPEDGKMPDAVWLEKTIREQKIGLVLLSP